MAGLQFLVLLTLSILISLSLVYCHESRDDVMLQDYPASYGEMMEAEESSDVVDEDSLQRLLNGLRQVRRKKDPCAIGAPGMSASCNIKDAIRGARVSSLIKELGRRKRQQPRY